MSETTIEDRIESVKGHFTPPASTHYVVPRNIAESEMATITPMEGEVRLVLQLHCVLDGHRQNRTLYLDDLLRLRADIERALARASRNRGQAS